MSERGAFTTEYFYCQKCYEAAKVIFSRFSDFEPFNSEGLPIICGKASGLFSGEEAFQFEHSIKPELEKKLCHLLKVAVLCDSGKAEIYQVTPAILASHKSHPPKKESP